ncbi:GntR family transcriptional regulator [Algibacter mikhailovii]|uniref:GntR family transcriptional regulator n=1 Tax=Algibacter mikhailovii TaxID=425498 RepID=UPI002494CAB9|nr:GntR family transcriptional regulator [Algibacter mikhailovii]
MIELIQLDANSGVPKYLQIIDSIIHNISIGKAKIGDKVPSINKLSEECYLSRDTVERAYSVLKKRNVIVSVRGKGTYVAQTQLISKRNVLFLVNKLSPYKLKIYNSFLKNIGENSHVDLHSYHCDETLFLELMAKYKSSYDYYVIMPHFRTKDLLHTNFTDRVNEALNAIPKDRLVLLDNNKHQLEGDFVEVYQDYENDIITSLSQGLKAMEKYKKLILAYPKKAFYPYPRRILNGFMKFCSYNNFDFEVIEEITSDVKLDKGVLYITIEEDDLVHVMKRIKESDFTLGSDIGVISYNDTPLKQILGITAISSDFQAMGEQAAKMIIENRKEKVKTPFYFADRGSI